MSDLRPSRFFWLRLGLTSFGGPLAQVATLEQECVRRRAWFTPEQFARVLGLCFFLPGPEAQQMVAWIAWRTGGWREAWIASLLFVGPGLLCCGVLAFAYAAYGRLPLVAGALAGARAAVAGVILVTAWRLARGVLNDAPRRAGAGASLVALMFGAPFASLALVAGAYGWFLHPAVAESASSPSVALRAAVARLVRYLLPLLGLFLLMWAVLGHRHGLVQLAEVSLLAVLASFGGAYAALGLWRHHAVREHAWMTDARFGDALVVGEATPGPLLLAGSFVGCVAGLQGHLGFPGGWLAGLLGLLIPAVFTFGPSTLVLLASAPLADDGLTEPRFQSMVGMVTASAASAVLWLGLTLVLDQCQSPALMLVTLAAGAALVWRRVNVPALVGAGAVVGWFLARQ